VSQKKPTPRRLGSLVSSIPALRWAKAWKTSVGPVIYQKLECLGIERGVLQLYVKDPVWRQELFYQRDVILKKFQAALTAEGFAAHEIPRSCSFVTKPTTQPFKSRNPKFR